MLNTLLIQPPALIPSEPPLSLAILAAALRQEGISVDAIDANLGAYLYLLDEDRLAALIGPTPARAISRALKHRRDSLRLLRGPQGADSFPRYSTAVRYLNLLLSLYAENHQRLTLSDYQYPAYSPFKPDDLHRFEGGERQTLFHAYFCRELLPQIAEKQPQRVAISINYLHQAFPAFELAGLLRQSYPDLEIVAGGGLITSWQQPLQQRHCRFSSFDRLVFGPGEASLVALARGQAVDSYFLSDISSRGFVPDFGFAEFDRYLSPHPLLPLSASRGCYWEKCLFCPEATAPVHPYGSFNPGDFPSLLLELSRRYGIKHFHLTDNAIPINVLKQLAHHHAELAELEWFGFVRFEEALTDFNFVRKLAAAGCRMLQLGLESGSQRILDTLRKGIRLETAAKILDNLQRAGIGTYVYIMLGAPGETEVDAEMTLDFLEKHADKIGFLNVSIMNLPRGSELLEDPEFYGISSSKLRDNGSALGLYHEFESVTGWNRTAVRRFLNQRLLASPLIRTIVKRDPPFFSSSHAIFFSQIF